MTPCPVCGAVMADQNRHLAWHIESETLTSDPRGNCPLDGMPLAVASSGEQGGYNHWACGHTYSWLAPSLPADHTTTSEENRP